jgi:phosphatidylserine/phosphatidylglycerophosphate/cardiolipin synthase-like enzyme
MIKKLRGLHGKLYIVDDRVLPTSANLTFAAFAQRAEAGVVLQGSTAQSAIALFEEWWDSATDFTKDDVLGLPRRQLQIVGVFLD